MNSVQGFYVRVDIAESDAGIDYEPVPGDSKHFKNLTFVDLHTSLRTPHIQPERLTAAVQDHLPLIVRTDQILFRWPWLGGPDPDSQAIAEIESWLKRLVGRNGGEPVIPPDIQVGVIQHRVARQPVLRWSDPDQAVAQDLLSSARATELHALLRYSNAIWKPTTYHYRLPSGEHTDTFVRIADAIQSPQDAYVLTSWLTPNLRDGIGVVVDNGSLTPLLLQIHSFLTQFDLTMGPTAILSAYPAGRPIVRRTIERAASDTVGRIMCIISVSSTGNLHATVEDEMERFARTADADYTLDVIVNRAAMFEVQDDLATTDQTSVSSWLRLPRNSATDTSASCASCQGSDKTPFVAVDPRTYGTMALPRPYLVMPDTAYAIDGQLFWKRIADHSALAIEANPAPHTRVARGKRAVFPIRPLLDVICQPDGLSEMVKKRWSVLKQRHPEFSQGVAKTKIIVTTPHDVREDARLPAFASGRSVNLKESLYAVLRGLDLPDTISVIASDATGLRSQLSVLDADDTVLAFSWGSVTGLTLRRLKLAIADATSRDMKEDGVNGLVFHSIQSTPLEWSALQNQFRPGMLKSLWTSCFPWSSPLSHEERLLDRLDGSVVLNDNAARRFLSERLGFFELHTTYADFDDDWSPRLEASDDGPHPEHVFWGMSRENVHQARVRGRSLYGPELDCLSAYAAIGSAINYTRLDARPAAAPRWVMFDMGRIVRSYFDAVIICSMLRWLQPGELWWGAERNDEGSVRDSVAFLLDQAADEKEQVLLVPELLLATVQGKVPTVAHDIVRKRAKEIVDTWPTDERFDLPRGAVEVGLALLDLG